MDFYYVDFFSVHIMLEVNKKKTDRNTNWKTPDMLFTLYQGKYKVKQMKILRVVFGILRR